MQIQCMASKEKEVLRMRGSFLMNLNAAGCDSEMPCLRGRHFLFKDSALCQLDWHLLQLLLSWLARYHEISVSIMLGLWVSEREGKRAES